MSDKSINRVVRKYYITWLIVLVNKLYDEEKFLKNTRILEIEKSFWVWSNKYQEFLGT